MPGRGVPRRQPLKGQGEGRPNQNGPVAVFGVSRRIAKLHTADRIPGVLRSKTPGPKTAGILLIQAGRRPAFSMSGVFAAQKLRKADIRRDADVRPRKV
jgi:hypothetical protein